MSRHRLERKPRARWDRIAAAGVSVVVTLIALLGGVGVIPLPSPEQASAADQPRKVADSAGAPAETAATGAPEAAPAGDDAALDDARAGSTPASREATARNDGLAVPADSGTGRRVVFSEGAQRVWLIGSGGKVKDSYLVSGSLTDNLDEGSYEVYSRSRWAVGIDDSGVMEYFVRFAHGKNAAIGFHSIPTRNGVPLQTEKQLGTPQSHGCIRQKRADAIEMWDFAPVGTTVVVVA